MTSTQKQLLLSVTILLVCTIAAFLYLKKQNKELEQYKNAFYTHLTFKPIEGYMAEQLICANTGEVLGTLQAEDVISKSWRFDLEHKYRWGYSGDAVGKSFVDAESIHSFLQTNDVAFFRKRCP